MKQKIIYQILFILFILSIGFYYFLKQDQYHFNQVSLIQIEANNAPVIKEEDFKKYYLTITDKKTIQELVKPLKKWKFKKLNEPESSLYTVNYSIQMNNGFTISFDSNFSPSSCFVTLNNEIHDGCVNQEFIDKLKILIQKEYSKLQ